MPSACTPVFDLTFTDMKKFSRFIIQPLVLIVLAILFWRWNHPALTDEQQIQAALDGIATQASHKSSGGITSFLAKDFQLDGVKKSDLQKQLTLGMLQYRVVNMKISGVQVQVSGDTATTKGLYDLGFKTEFSSPEEKYSSDFSLKWKREDSQWKIADAQGNKLPPGLGG